MIQVCMSAYLDRSHCRHCHKGHVVTEALTTQTVQHTAHGRAKEKSNPYGNFGQPHDKPELRQRAVCVRM